jgi:uncharacterized oxidoreductase
MNHTGHVVLITGGATGIGFALAQKFLTSGNRVIIVGRSEERLAAARVALPGVVTCKADIAVPTDRDRLMREYPDVSILINNAGTQIAQPILKSTPEAIEHELNVNFLSPVLLCRGFLPALLAQESAAIMNVSSALAFFPKETAPTYCAAKAALHSFSRTLRWQLEGTTVKVFEIIPPLVDTAMTVGRSSGKITPAQLAEEFWKEFKRDHFEMRIGKTKLFAFLARFAPFMAERMIRPGR